MVRALRRLINKRGAPQLIRSDNGSEFVAGGLKMTMDELGVETAQVAPASSWQNGRNERLNGILRYELLEREVFTTLMEAQVLHEQWRRRYNEVRPHGVLNFMTPSAFAKHEGLRGALFEDEVCSDTH